MGGTSSGKKRRVDPAVRKFIGSVSGERRALYDRLEAVILGMYPDAEVVITYGIPTYKANSGRVGLAYWKEGVSFYPFGGSYLDEFRANYPAIKTSKGAVNFKLTDKVPVTALKKVIRYAIDHPRKDWKG